MESKRRSLLFVPAIRDDFLYKLNKYKCDSIIFDLEDSVSVDFKDKARQNLLKVDYSELKDKETILRINGFDTSFFEKDLILLNKIKPDIVMIPKYEDDAILDVFRSKIEYPVKFLPIIETVKGYFKAKEILGASKRIVGVAFGAEDFCMETDTYKDVLYENPLLIMVISQIILVSKLYKIDFIDCVYTGYKTSINLKKLKKEAEFSKNLGAKGKLIIHPSQIETVNDVYSISEEEIKYAMNFVEIFNDQSANSGYAVSNIEENIMKDIPTYKKCKKIIQEAIDKGYY